jgi:hypothetical protein
MKITRRHFGIVTKTLRRIIDLPIKVGNILCNMVLLIVDTYSYDVLLGLDFLMKIGAIVGVEKGVIHVRNGTRMVVELLPLILINMLHP